MKCLVFWPARRIDPQAKSKFDRSVERIAWMVSKLTRRGAGQSHVLSSGLKKEEMVLLLLATPDVVSVENN